MAWLNENWLKLIETVQTLATKYGQEHKENIVGTISSIEAREALKLQKGNVWQAITECIERRQCAFNAIRAQGNYSREDIVTYLTAHNGNIEATVAELEKIQKPFLLRIPEPPAEEEIAPAALVEASRANAEEANKTEPNDPAQESQVKQTDKDEERSSILRDIEAIIVNMEEKQSKKTENILSTIESLLHAQTSQSSRPISSASSFSMASLDRIDVRSPITVQGRSPMGEASLNVENDVKDFVSKHIQDIVPDVAAQVHEELTESQHSEEGSGGAEQVTNGNAENYVGDENVLISAATTEQTSQDFGIEASKPSGDSPMIANGGNLSMNLPTATHGSNHVPSVDTSTPHTPPREDDNMSTNFSASVNNTPPISQHIPTSVEPTPSNGQEIGQQTQRTPSPDPLTQFTPQTEPLTRAKSNSMEHIGHSPQRPDQSYKYATLNLGKARGSRQKKTKARILDLERQLRMTQKLIDMQQNHTNGLSQYDGYQPLQEQPVHLNAPHQVDVNGNTDISNEKTFSLSIAEPAFADNEKEIEKTTMQLQNIVATASSSSQSSSIFSQSSSSATNEEISKRRDQSESIVLQSQDSAVDDQVLPESQTTATSEKADEIVPKPSHTVETADDKSENDDLSNGAHSEQRLKKRDLSEMVADTKSLIQQMKNEIDEDIAMSASEFDDELDDEFEDYDSSDSWEDIEDESVEYDDEDDDAESMDSLIQQRADDFIDEDEEESESYMETEVGSSDGDSDADDDLTQRVESSLAQRFDSDSGYKARGDLGQRVESGMSQRTEDDIPQIVESSSVQGGMAERGNEVESMEEAAIELVADDDLKDILPVEEVDENATRGLKDAQDNPFEEDSDEESLLDESAREETRFDEFIERQDEKRETAELAAEAHSNVQEIATSGASSTQANEEKAAQNRLYKIQPAELNGGKATELQVSGMKNGVAHVEAVEAVGTGTENIESLDEAEIQNVESQDEKFSADTEDEATHLGANGRTDRVESQSDSSHVTEEDRSSSSRLEGHTMHFEGALMNDPSSILTETRIQESIDDGDSVVDGSNEPSLHAIEAEGIAANIKSSNSKSSIILDTQDSPSEPIEAVDSELEVKDSTVSDTDTYSYEESPGSKKPKILPNRTITSDTDTNSHEESSSSSKPTALSATRSVASGRKLSVTKGKAATSMQKSSRPSPDRKTTKQSPERKGTKASPDRKTIKPDQKSTKQTANQKNNKQLPDQNVAKQPSDQKNAKPSIAEPKPTTNGNKIPVRRPSFTEPSLAIKSLQNALFNRQTKVIPKIISKKPSKIVPPKLFFKDVWPKTAHTDTSLPSTSKATKSASIDEPSTSTGITRTLPEKKYYETCFSDDYQTSDDEKQPTSRKVIPNLVKIVESTTEESFDAEAMIQQWLDDERIVTYEEGGLAIDLIQRKFKEDLAVWAATQCTTIEQALHMLRQECELCTETYPMNKIVSMLKCEHSCCENCARNYFTIQVRDVIFWA